jgi:molecular chaperone GrpE (heat shock protein)
MFLKIIDRLNHIAADVAETKAMVKGAIAVQDQIADALQLLGVGIGAPMETGEPVDAPDDIASLFGLRKTPRPPKGP